MIEGKEILVELPQGITAEINGKKITLKGNGKENSKEFRMANIELKQDSKGVKIITARADKKAGAVMNAAAKHIKNLAKGLKGDFIYKMEIVYSHFPMTIAVKGNIIEINNLCGSKKIRKAKIIGNTKVEVKGKDITVRGNNVEAAGQTAANIERATRIVGRDIRVFQDGIYIVEKPEKA